MRRHLSAVELQILPRALVGDVGHFMTPCTGVGRQHQDLLCCSSITIKWDYDIDHFDFIIGLFSLSGLHCAIYSPPVGITPHTLYQMYHNIIYIHKNYISTIYCYVHLRLKHNIIFIYNLHFTIYRHRHIHPCALFC